MASRLLLEDGRREGMDAGHPFAPQYADEVAVTRVLPEGVGPGVLWWSTPEKSGGWWWLCLEDIPGTMPVLAPGTEDTVRAVEAVRWAGRVLTPSPLPGARPITDLAGRWFAGWATLSTDPPADLDPWAARHLERLVGVEQGWQDAADGTTLLHFDLRPDNMLARPGGPVVITPRRN
ncbi:phosphotransferase [Streptomyces sp. NPDC007369]|uniref:phosphotransferase n=1 Tax=Streptomyces sp. NPDC007369 TaxID=3154589 RepID=UPI0034028D8F